MNKVEPEFIEILRSDFDRLVQSETLLIMLQSHGVDNWEGYSDALFELEHGHDRWRDNSECEICNE